MPRPGATTSAERAGPEQDKDVAGRVDAIIAKQGSAVARLIPILLDIQETFRYLPEEALEHLARRMGVPIAHVYGVATFYSQFRLRPAGVHRVKVCIGTACHVKGAESIYKAFCRHLEIPDGEDTDAARLFTVEKVACLGCCMLAPAVQIGQTTYGHVTPERVPAVIRDVLAASRQRGDEEAGRSHREAGTAEIRLCCCTSCMAAGAGTVWEAIGECLDRYTLPVRPRNVACTGASFEAPLMEVVQEDGRVFRYGHCTPDAVEECLLRHFRPAKLGRRLEVTLLHALGRVVRDQLPETVTRYALDVRDTVRVPYWQKQRHVVLEFAGEIEPLDFESYRAHGGFEALERCNREPAPETLMAEIEHSGLRGRGGAGFATARKWKNVRAAHGPRKILVCNGDEGDPGSFMDRMILESFPFRVIEGMAIAGAMTGAHEGFLYIRGEYPLAVARIREAIRMCEEQGFLARETTEEGTGLTLRVVEGAGAFVCGEETALLAAIEGRRGMPRVRPPYPSEHGLWGCPTLVNNVETFAAVPWIVRNGADAFREMGTAGSPGTKTFALAGRIINGGLIEVPMGMTVRQIVYDIGGGIQDGRRLKAVQIGGPSGGCIPTAEIDTPIDFDALRASGTMMGSGGLVVLDETDCMVDIARYFLAFTQSESCGKCTPCRVGTRRLLDLLERLCAGRGKERDLVELEELAGLVAKGSLCGLGRTAPNPILSALRFFRDEFEAHVDGRCPAKRCRALVRYVITDDCIGCTRCAQRCPVDAIAFRPHEKHEVDSDLCIRCGTCREVCPADAVVIEDVEA